MNTTDPRLRLRWRPSVSGVFHATATPRLTCTVEWLASGLWRARTSIHHEDACPHLPTPEDAAAEAERMLRAELEAALAACA